MKKFLFILITLLYACTLKAQLYNDAELTNDGGLISDWENQWFNTINGIYNGSNNGVFEHRGPSSQTFINNGTYNATTGHTDQFLGPLGSTGAQEIGGSARPFFFNLLLNNGATDQINITNTDGANVRGTATFSNGITTTTRNTHQLSALRFEDNATYTGGNTDAQHVNGYVSKTGDDAFTFPIGSGTDLRTLTVTAPAVASEISAAWFTGNPSSVTDPSDGGTHATTSVTGPIVSVSPAGFWDWISVSGSDDNQVITVSIPDASTYAATVNLRLVGWNGSSWIDLSGASTASGNTENSTLSGTIPAGANITALAIGSTTFPLPVRWESFEAIAKQNCNVELIWSTSFEENTAYYEAERSTDGSSYTAFARVAAAGNSGVSRAYQVIDKNGLQGTAYYRIRQVDRDGKITYSEIRAIIDPIAIGCRDKQIIAVYPTLTRGAVTVQLPQGYEQALVRVIDTKGQLLPVPVQGSGSYRYVSMNALPAGVYLVQVINNETKEISNHKVVVQ